MDNGGPYHVYPINRGHVTRNLICWCQPIAYLPCPEQCNPTATSPPCWCCNELGIVRASQYDITTRSHELIIVHNDYDHDNHRPR